jgi:hypothetical protein
VSEPSTGPSPERSPSPQQVVGTAIQDLMAARLARAFVPLVGLLLIGVVGVIRPVVSDSTVLVMGSIAASAAMLAYGLRVVQRALGRDHRRWMGAALLGSVVPPAFALYVLAWHGLRELFGGGVLSSARAILLCVLGVWTLRSWMKIVEVEQLARVMAMNVEDEGGPG